MIYFVGVRSPCRSTVLARQFQLAMRPALPFSPAPKQAPVRKRIREIAKLSRSAHACAAAARRLACKHQTRAQASAGSGEIGGQPTITLSEGAQSAVGRRMLVPCLTAYWRTRILLPSTKTSILVRKKQSSASSGLQTMGSFSLKEVLRTIGTSVSSSNASISA
jgi:hypothetical protein